MDSVIVSAFSKLWENILQIIYDSLSYRIFSGISGFLKRVVHSSYILGGLMRPVDYTESSGKSRFAEIFSKVPGKIGSILSSVGKWIGTVVKSSRILLMLFDFFFNFLFQPLRTFGIMAVTAGTSYLILTGIISVIGIKSVIASVVMLVVGGLLTTTKVSLYTVLNNSRFIRFILGKRGSLESLGVADNRKSQSHNVLAVIMGLIVSVIPVLLPTLYAVAGITALFAVPLVIIWPVIGLVGLALTIAFIPTMLAAGLIILTWTGVILNASVGRLSCRSAFLKGKVALIYIIITIAGGILSFAIADSIPIAMIYILFISVVFLFIILVKDSLSLKAILMAAAIAALGTAVIGIYQYLTGNIEVGWIDSEMFAGMVRIYSTFENPNVYGEYLLFMIPLSLVLFFSSERILFKLLWLGTGLLTVAAMLLTMSRGCWIGLAAGVFIYFLIADRRYLWLFLGALIIMPFILPDSIMVRLLSIGNLEDSSSLYRLYIWLGTFSMLKDYWLTGVGLGTGAFSGVYSAYAYNGIIAPHPHNMYLNIISETGIVGLLGFLWASITGLKNSISTAFRGSGFNRHMGAGLTAAFIGIFVQGMFDNVFYNYRIVLVFWMFIAFSFAYALINKKVVQDD